MKTFKKAREEILAHLGQFGWDVKSFNMQTMKAMKVPHATSPDKSIRLWFHQQAVWVGDSAASSRSLHMDIRLHSPEELVEMARALWS